jgi:uncharacterized membrane protein YraQ (UPF0718 family)
MGTGLGHEVLIPSEWIARVVGGNSLLAGPALSLPNMLAIRSEGGRPRALR